MIYSRQIKHTTDGKEEHILGRGGGHSKGKVVFSGAMSNLVSKKMETIPKKKMETTCLCMPGVRKLAVHCRAAGQGPQQGVLDSLGSAEGTGLPSRVGGSVGCGWGAFPWKTPSELVFVGLEQVFMGRLEPYRFVLKD